MGTTPYWPERGGLRPGAPRGILELPWPVFHLGLRFPTAGGPLLRLLGKHYIALGLRDSLRRGDSVFYFHPIDISDEKFPIEKSVARPLFWSVKGEIVQKRVRWLVDEFAGSLACCSEIVARALPPRCNPHA
ncbi:MAG: DUF3473 domain-containing protein [Candidatus Bipolaricaulia bacterium]